MAITITQLVAFLAVAEHGSASAAAKQLVVTQPSVSAAITSLQRELGTTLVARDGRHLRLTAAGRAYLPYATDVIGLLGQGARAAQESGTDRPTLRIGAVMTAGEHLVAPLLRTFRDAHPGLEISLRVGNRQEMLADLVAREVDVAIMGRAPIGLALHGLPFADNEFVLVTAPDDALARRRAVAPEELARRQWLVREPGSGTRRLCEEYLAGHELNPSLLTLGSNVAIKQAVGLGLGVALQSRWAVGLELKLGMLGTVALRGGLPRRSWYVVHSTVGPVRPAASSFVEFVQSATAQRALAGALATTT